MKKTLFAFAVLLSCGSALQAQTVVPDSVMDRVYEEVKTPFKYGMVVPPADTLSKVDCPSVFRKGDSWYMTYLIYNGRGYQTWLAKSTDLLNWETLGNLLAFTDTTDWDCNQKAGYISLEDKTWGGTYEWEKYKGKYWMSYFGGPNRGYETPPLSISMAYTKKDPSVPHAWQRLGHPVLSTSDKDTTWWDDRILYKSTVIRDDKKFTGHSFIMYYNANGDSARRLKGVERIGMATSDDMVTWKRYGTEPVLDHHKGITGDPYIQKMGNLYVMFYFGAFYPGLHGTANSFACSYDLIHWTDFKGKSLIEPTEEYEGMFAHKSYVVKWKGVVYHFYCAVNKKNQRGIAVATSVDKGKSKTHFLPKVTKKG